MLWRLKLNYAPKKVFFLFWKNLVNVLGHAQLLTITKLYIALKLNFLRRLHEVQQTQAATGGVP